MNEHIFPVRVYYEDTDFSGRVYFANYLKFMERGRSEFLRALGVLHQDLASREAMTWAVKRLSVDYLKPALLEDSLAVHTKAVRGGRRPRAPLSGRAPRR